MADGDAPIVVDTGPVAAPLTKAEILAPAVLVAYRRMLSYLFCATIAIILVIALPLVFSGDPPIFVLVILTGALGAFFSALARLYGFEELPEALLQPDIGRWGRLSLVIYSLVPPLTGAIGAAVIYMLFAAGFVKGDLFPTFICKALGEGACNSLPQFLQSFGPAQASDYAKALLWGFVAGFSERLIPDALQSFAKRLK
jgi:hypothetical protein